MTINNQYNTKDISKLMAKGFIPVSSLEELNNINSNNINLFGRGTSFENFYIGGLDKNYIQTTNIDAKNINFTPIGDIENTFSGHYDGGNFTINNLKISNAGDDIGIFGATDNDACLQNIHNISNIIKGINNVGGIVGRIKNTFVLNCSFTGIIEGESLVGGVVGYAEFSSISQCKTSGNLTSKNNDAGGIAGKLKWTPIDNSISNINITSKSDRVGGIAGCSYDASIASCTVGEVDIMGDNNIGGLIGFSDGVYIGNSNSSAKVKGERNIGKLFGISFGRDTKNYDDSYISNSYFKGLLAKII